jgi:hypothetical protein
MGPGWVGPQARLREQICGPSGAGRLAARRATSGHHRLARGYTAPTVLTIRGVGGLPRQRARRPAGRWVSLPPQSPPGGGAAAGVRATSQRRYPKGRGGEIVGAGAIWAEAGMG